MKFLVAFVAACNGGPAVDASPQPEPVAQSSTQPSEPVEPPMPLSPAEHHAQNLRFRDNPVVFEESARWLDAHRDEALPVMAAKLAEEGPAAIGVARVLGVMSDPRGVPALEGALRSTDDELAFEAARALSKIPGVEAEGALRKGAAAAEPVTVKNALRGIELRGDPALCDAVRPRLSDPEPVATYARRAAEKLGCP